MTSRVRLPEMLMLLVRRPHPEVVALGEPKGPPKPLMASRIDTVFPVISGAEMCFTPKTPKTYLTL